MARATVLGRLSWQLGEVAEVIQETPRVSSLVLEVPVWPGHLAGQHVDVRLTAEDGYQAQRSYSIASAPEDPRIILTVERLEDGEVSPYLVGEVRVGDKVELRGPIGGYFVWKAGDDRPLLLDGEMVAEVAWPRKNSPAVFICGPTAFVETAAGLLLESGYDTSWIKTERFGATGG